MRTPSSGCEGTMVIPILALVVAIGLALYLLVTLLAPERF